METCMPRFFSIGFIATVMGALAALTLAACTPHSGDKSVADKGSPEPGATGWPTYGGQPTGTKYSALDQINIHNVGKLKVAWTYHTGELSRGTDKVDPTVYEVTPILANNRLYLCTPFNTIVALDPGSGKPLWRFDPGRPHGKTYFHENLCRGVSYWAARNANEQTRICGKRIFEGSEDGTLIAVDADTGRLCAGFGEGGKIPLNALDYKGQGTIGLTSPPAVYKDVVMVGATILDNVWSRAPHGIVRGFDARTGRQIWSWDPIPAKLSDKTGAANTWPPMSVDQEHGWVFLPTGSPSYDMYGANRNEPIPYANAVVVLDALTGKLVWSYQIVRHDLWDYDVPATPALATLERDGKPVRAVIQATKMGYIFVLDRLTGKPLFPVEDRRVAVSDVPGEQSSPTQPVPLAPPAVTSQSLKPSDAWGALLFDQAACRKRLEGLRNEGIYTPPSLRGSLLHPSFLGGTDWGGVAYDRASGLMVVNSSNLATSLRLVPRGQWNPKRDYKPGMQVFAMPDSPYLGIRQVLLSPLGAPCNPPPWGRLTAIDVASGQVRWQVPFGRKELFGFIPTPKAWGAPNQGGPIITKGGLVFIGASVDRRFRAFDLHTGEQVWSAKIPASANATPMTYAYGPSNTQYVVIAAGGESALGTAMSDSIVAFALDR
jgi:quinoprotein glucose dehydrogenase